MGNGCRPSLALGIGIAPLSSTTKTSLAAAADLELLDRAGPRATNPGRSKKDLVEFGRDLFFNETLRGQRSDLRHLPSGQQQFDDRSIIN